MPKKNLEPQPYPGFHYAVARATRTLVRLEKLEKLANLHRPSNYTKIRHVRPLDLEIFPIIERLREAIAQARREIADKLPAK